MRSVEKSNRINLGKEPCIWYSRTMGKNEKLYEHIMLRRSDSNVAFDRLCTFLKRLGFKERIKGDHHIFTMESVEEILNLQPKDGKAKSYQVKQIRNVIIKYDLHLGV